MVFRNKNCNYSSIRTISQLVTFLLTVTCVLTIIISADPETVDGGTTEALNVSTDDDNDTSHVLRTSGDDAMSTRHELQFWHSFRDGRGPPCFSLSRAHALTRSCRSTCNVLFENDIIGFGGNFDRKSGYFFCNVPGLYFVTFSAISHAYSSFRVALIKNGQEIVSSYGAANGYDTSGNNIVLPLLGGDKLSLVLLEGELYESEAPFRAYTTFSGFLIPFPHPDYDAHRKTPPLPFRPIEKPEEPGKPFPGFIGGGGVFPEAGPRSSLPFLDDDVEILEDHEKNFREPNK